MSRAFVKETDEGPGSDDLLERPQSKSINYVTPNGLVQLKSRYQELLKQKQSLVNSDGPQEKQRLAQVERDLRYFQARLESANLVNPLAQPADKVLFGATVKVSDESVKIKEYTIVGEDEADMHSGKVSWVSPLAEALLGAVVGDVVVWERPSGDSELEVLSIR